MISHVLVFVLVVTMVNLGLWQLSRLSDRKSNNELVTERALVAPVDMGSLIDTEAGLDVGDELNYRHVFVRGTYDPDKEFTIESRTLNGAPGRWVVTPLSVDGDTDDVVGGTVLVLRGFVPQSVNDTEPPFDGVVPPNGPVALVGYLRKTVEKRAVQGPSFLKDSAWARIDIGEYRRRVDEDTLPMFVQLAEQNPASDAPLLSAVPLPELTDGPHFGYAMQWFIFSTIAGGGYFLILFRLAKQRQP